MRCRAVCSATTPGTAQRLTNAVPSNAASRAAERSVLTGVFSSNLEALFEAKFAFFLFHKLYDNPATLTDALYKRVYLFSLSLQLCFHTSVL